MPHQEHAFRRDHVLYWEKSGVDRYGQASVPSTPLEIRVRFDDKKTALLTDKENSSKIDVVIVAKRAMRLQSIVLHSTLAEYMGTGSGLTSNNFLEVVSVDITPDIKNRASAYVIGLSWYKGELPSNIG